MIDFFAGPINFDTIEGILRSQAFLRSSPGIRSPESVTAAALRRANIGDQSIVDDFWHCKDLIYRQVINSRTGVLADYACQLFMRRHLKNIVASDYFNTEEQMFRKIPDLLQLLTSPSFETDIAVQLIEPIKFNARRFYVDSNADFFLRDDELRYRQVKHERILNLPKIAEEPGLAVKKDAKST